MEISGYDKSQRKRYTQLQHMANTYTQWLTQWQTDTQSDTYSDDTHRHFDCKTCWLKLSQICVFEGEVRRIDFLSVLTCTVICVHFLDNRSNSWLCGTVALKFKATCQCRNHCTYFQHEHFTILSTFVKLQNYMYTLQAK